MKIIVIIAVTLSALATWSVYNMNSSYDELREQMDIEAVHSMSIETTTKQGYKLVTHVSIKGRISGDREELITRLVKSALHDYDPNLIEDRVQAEEEISANLEHKHVPLRDLTIWHRVNGTTCDKTGCYTKPLKGEGK